MAHRQGAALGGARCARRLQSACNLRLCPQDDRATEFAQLNFELEDIAVLQVAGTVDLTDSAMGSLIGDIAAVTNLKSFV
jgi:hypothetical protein